MPTSTAKAMRRAEHGLPSKVRTNLPNLRGNARQPVDMITRRTTQKRGANLDSTKSVSPSGRSSRGRSAVVPGRVSHAYRSRKNPR